MKQTLDRLGIIAGLVSCLAGGVRAGYVWDDFESYFVGTTLSSLSAQGWGASTDTVVVAANVSAENPSKSVALPADTVATGLVAVAGAGMRIWTDCLMTEAQRVEPSMLPLPTAGAMAMAGVTTGGYAVVYNPSITNWDVCTNDALGQGIATGIASGTWVRVSVCLDFGITNAAVFLNGRVVRTGIPFIAAQSTCLGLRFRSGASSTGYVDNVYVSNAVPPALQGPVSSTNLDINGDGTPDAQELMTYGVLAVRVTNDYATLNIALAANPPSGRIVVTPGDYAEAVVISNATTLIGTVLTNLTSLTVSSGQVATVTGFTNLFCANLVVGTNAVFAVNSATASVSALTLLAGGQVAVSNGSLSLGGVTKTGTFTVYTVTNIASAGTGGTLTPAGTNTYFSQWQDVPYSVTAGVAYVVGAVTNNGVVTTYAGPKMATYTDAKAGMTNTHVITAGFVYTGIRYVPGDYGTITAALAAAQANDQIIVSNGTYALSVTLSNGVTLVGSNMTGNATNLLIDGNLNVAQTGIVSMAGGWFTVTGQVSVAADGLLTLNAVTNNFGDLVIASGGAVQVNNGTLTVNGITLSGTFTLDSGWNSGHVAQTLNYTNDFESYGVGQPLNRCGAQGWVASDAGSVVQSTVAVQLQRAAMVTAGMVVSNVIQGRADQTKVWTDLYLQDTSVKDPAVAYPSAPSGRTVVLFVNTNNHVVIWNSNAWDECVFDIAGNDIPSIPSGQWARVSVFLDYLAGKAAVFVDGRLVRQQVPFVSPVASYHGFGLNAGSGSAYMDDVKVWTNVPPTLTSGAMSDLDQDGSPDALEIQNCGTTTLWPQGSVFKIR
jgi:hypothetical protein